MPDDEFFDYDEDLTVGELRKLIENIPDNYQVVLGAEGSYTNPDDHKEVMISHPDKEFTLNFP